MGIRYTNMGNLFVGREAKKHLGPDTINVFKAPPEGWAPRGSAERIEQLREFYDKNSTRNENGEYIKGETPFND